MFQGKVSKSLLYENVVQKLIEMIELGVVRPGEQFPTERELVERMEVSRNVLREAFHILEEKGIISSVQGKGRFLRRIPPKGLQRPSVLDLQKYSLLELYQTRIILELGAMDILVAEAEEEDICELEEVLRRLSAKFRRNKNPLGEFEMHLAYVRASHNEYLQSLLQHTVDRVYRIIWEGFPAVASSYDYEIFIDDHTRILGAIRDRDASAARDLLRAHLHQPTHDIENAPVEQPATG